VSEYFKYPKTSKRDFKEIIHGVEIYDPYQWLEDFENSEVQDWIRKQNELTDELIPANLRNKLINEILPWLDIELETVHVHKGDFLFFYRRIKGKNQSVFIVKNVKNKEERILIDPNEWSEDGTIALDWTFPSPDGKYLAYGRSSSGSEWSTLYVIEVETGRILSDEIPRTRWCSLAWKSDNTGFYYTRYPDKSDVPYGEENYHRKLYFHKIGDNYREDQVIIGDLRKKEELIWIKAASNNKDFIITRTIDWVKNDLYLLLDTEKEIIPICENLDGYFSADYIDGKLYSYTNYKAPKGKIIEIDPENPAPENWNTIIEEGEDIIEGYNFKLGRNSIVILKLHNCNNKLEIYDLEGKQKHEINLPTLGSVFGVSASWDKNEIYFEFQSFFYPPTIFKANITTGETRLVFQPTVDIDFDKFEVKQEWFVSKDGTSIPMFIVYSKDSEINGKRPVYLTGYGGFNASLTPGFICFLPLLLNRGIIYAQVNLRGGGEFGKEWHLAGRKENKQNAFDDFISAAEWLIENNYTDSDHLVISGGSNGGLLVGAALTQRPDLYKAVICRVPLLDMLRYHKFHVANIWSDEYGSSDKPEEFNYLYAYSPYHNAKKNHNYPATLFTTAESDSRVHPMHALKMTAKLQEIEKRNPILLQYETKAGHGAGKPLKKKAETYAYFLGFMLWQLGLE